MRATIREIRRIIGTLLLNAAVSAFPTERESGMLATCLVPFLKDQVENV